MNIHKDLPPMTIQSYLKDFVVGLILWIPYAVIAFALPIIGWILIPTIPFFPFIYPFLKRQNDKKKLMKLRKEALEEKQFKQAFSNPQ